MSFHIVHSGATRAEVQKDLDTILNGGHSPYRRLFEIDSESARALLEGVQINWP